MALEKRIEEASGLIVEQSYWNVGQCNIAIYNKTGQITFLGYLNKAAKEAGKQPLAQKNYVINPEIYDEYFSPDELNPEGRNPIKASYDMAKAIKDVNIGTQEQPIMVSFFDGAKDV